MVWAERWTADLDAADAPHEAWRLGQVQRQLIELVDVLDPDRVRYPDLNIRGKLPLPASDAQATKPVARFLWREDPWPVVERWAADTSHRLGSSGDHARTYHGRRGLTGKRPEVVVKYDGRWVTLDALLVGRKAATPVAGSLRSTRGRSAINRLLRSFDRPTVAGGSTLPSRLAGRAADGLARLRD